VHGEKPVHCCHENTTPGRVGRGGKGGKGRGGGSHEGHLMELTPETKPLAELNWLLQ